MIDRKDSMERCVMQTIREHHLILPEESVVVGVSGGPDSLCLFHLLCRLKEELEIKALYVVHVNHQIRGKDADDDQAFTKALCKRNEVECFTYVRNVKELSRIWKMGEEEAGRKIRYDAFNEVAETTGAQKVAVAQNANDQAETLLMRLIRGTGPDGLCGIDYMRDGRFIRPLLDIGREKIETYCKENQLNPRIDLTNFQSIYQRNKIRLELLPYLEKNFSPKMKENLCRLGRIMKEDKDFIYQTVENILEQDLHFESSEKAIFPYEVLKELHPAIRKRLILHIFSLIGKRNNISEVQLEEVEEAVKKNKTSIDIDIPGNQMVRIRYDKVFFEIKKSKNKQESEVFFIQDGSEVFMRSIGLQLKATYLEVSNEKNNCQSTINDKMTMYLHLTGTSEKLLLRTRREGDLFSPQGFHGTKKLKAFFIDEKIDRELRDKIPLLCIGNRVLWIIGIRKGVSDHAEALLNSSNGKVLKVECKFTEDMEFGLKNRIENK